jgi:limonene-1,2-epoxide hydrolase
VYFAGWLQANPRPEPRDILSRRQLDGGIVREQTVQVVEAYINAVRSNDASAAPLHPDVLGEFPTNTYRGAEPFRQSLQPFARMVKRVDVLRLVADGEHCVALLELDTVFGRIPFAEHIHVVNGQIVYVRGYFDPRPILAGMQPAT